MDALHARGQQGLAIRWSREYGLVVAGPSQPHSHWEAAFPRIPPPTSIPRPRSMLDQSISRLTVNATSDVAATSAKTSLGLRDARELRAAIVHFDVADRSDRHPAASSTAGTSARRTRPACNRSSRASLIASRSTPGASSTGLGLRSHRNKILAAQGSVTARSRNPALNVPI